MNGDLQFACGSNPAACMPHSAGEWDALLADARAVSAEQRRRRRPHTPVSAPARMAASMRRESAPDAALEAAVLARIAENDATVLALARAFGFGDDVDGYLRRYHGGSMVAARLSIEKGRLDAMIADGPHDTREAEDAIALAMGPGQVKALAAWRARQQQQEGLK